MSFFTSFYTIIRLRTSELIGQEITLYAVKDYNKRVVYVKDHDNQDNILVNIF